MSAWPALVRLSNRRLSELSGMRIARGYAFGIALSFTALVALLPTANRGTLDWVIVEALRSASWVVAGLSALSTARDLEQRDRAEGFASVFALRGTGPRERALSHWIAGTMRIAVGVGTPAFSVLIVGALRTSGPGQGPWFALWAGLIALYAGALGAMLILLSRGSVLALPRHGRFALLCVVLVPELLRAVADWPLPSLPYACGSFLELAKSWARSSA